MSKISFTLKIFFAMTTAYLLAIFCGTKFFKANSPRINTEYIASFWSSFEKKPSNTQMQQLHQKIGGIEMAISEEEQKKHISSLGKKENPIPNAVFQYISQGVATAKASEGIVLRIDPETKREFRRFKLKDGTFIDIVVLK